ncbi:MAG: NAD(P)/FAD-dependent oxidoreductase, partial [Chloroflexi bacterium]|nr:NAD(P)/FAD-dependent oxidoreductase [Chloroflexota bacterium]
MDDVIVVGGGPAGSYVASRLAALGHKVSVLEKHAAPGQAHCCTGIVGTECFRHLRLRQAEPTVLRSARSASFFSPAGKVVRLEKDTPQAYILSRPLVDLSLAERAQHNGAQYLFGCNVHSAACVNSHVQIDTIYSGRRCLFEAKALVLASGFNPGLTDRLGLGSVGDFAAGAQVEVETTGIAEVEVYLSRAVAPGFFAWLVPTTANMALAGVISRHAPGENLLKFLQELRARARIVEPSSEIRYGRIPLRPLRRTYARRILAVGDAAGQVKPTTGGGIYYGLLCGDIAVDVLSEAFANNDFSERHLAEYEKRWKKALSREVRMGYLSRLIFEKLTDQQID